MNQNLCEGFSLWNEFLCIDLSASVVIRFVSFGLCWFVLVLSLVFLYNFPRGS